MTSPSKLRINNLEIQFTKSPKVGGGEFERLIGLKIHSLYKSIGKSQLSCNKLGEILLNVKINLNDFPLTYIEEVI